MSVEAKRKALVIWLTEGGYRILITTSKTMRGCLVRDSKLILIKGDDPPEEQLFTLAHEIAHIILPTRGPFQREKECDELARRILEGVP